jgi:hypothetical protein
MHMTMLRPRRIREGAESFCARFSRAWREQHHLALQQLSYIIVDGPKSLRNLERLRQVRLQISTVSCTLILSLLLTLQVTAVVAAASGGCSSQKCGNVTVSYPFGIKGAGCGLPGFQLNCSTNSSNLSYSNLSLSTVSGTYQVTALDASYLVLDATPLKAWTYSSLTISFQVADTSPYLIDTYNVLFGYGANTTAQFSTDQDGGTHPSCQNLAVNQFTIAYCDYYACCSAANVPPGVRTVNMSASEVAGSGAEGYASIIYPETYSTPSAAAFGAGSWGLRLGWYLPGNCSIDGNSTCSANTTCSDTTGAGFRCACLQGWQGDGYSNGTGCIGRFDFCYEVFVNLLRCCISIWCRVIYRLTLNCEFSVEIQLEHMIGGQFHQHTLESALLASE